MGIITTVLFFNYTKQFETKEVVQEQPMIQVVKAKEKIAENQLITKEVLEVVNVPEENIHPQAVTDVKQAAGNYTSSVIEKGEILLTHRIKKQENETLIVSRKVKEGYRAVSVGTNMVQSVTNMIEPEDYVDVILTKKDDKDKNPSEQIFSNVRVLAVGRKMKAPVNGKSTYVEYSAVTLELKPEQALALVNASAKGNIHFILHPSVIQPGD